MSRIVLEWDAAGKLTVQADIPPAQAIGMLSIATHVVTRQALTPPPGADPSIVRATARTPIVGRRVDA